MAVVVLRAVAAAIDVYFKESSFFIIESGATISIDIPIENRRSARGEQNASLSPVDRQHQKANNRGLTRVSISIRIDT